MEELFDVRVHGLPLKLIIDDSCSSRNNSVISEATVHRNTNTELDGVVAVHDVYFLLWFFEMFLTGVEEELNPFKVGGDVD